MGFSSIAVAQREKEAEALKSFLTFSLVGSLILHIAVLASGITNLLTRVPELKDEPIELTLVEPTDLETPKPPEEVQPSPEPPVPSRIARQIEPAPETQASATSSVPSEPQPVIKLEKPITPQTNTPERKVVDNSQPEVAKVPQQNVVKPKQITEAAKPVEKTIIQAPQPDASTQKADPQLRELLSGIRNLRASQGSSSNDTGNSNNAGGGGGTSSPVALGNGIGNGMGNGSGNGIGNGIGNGTGNGIGNGIGNGSGTGKPIATAPTSPKLPANSDRDSNGSGNGRAACRKCHTKYPEAARRRGIEGRVEVAVDTDDRGNVTNVRIARSSGNRELDEETLRQAREWKLKPAAGGRQGVSIATEFAIQGSRRHREIQERKKRAQAVQRSQPPAASNASSNEETPRRRRIVTPTNTENTGETTTENRSSQRRSPTASSEATENRISQPLRLPRTETPASNSSNQSNIRESLRRQRENVGNTSQSQSQVTNNRRRWRTQQPTSPSQNKLIDTLRRSRQPSQSTDTPATSGN